MCAILLEFIMIDLLQLYQCKSLCKVQLCLFLCVSACSCMFSYLCDYLREGNTLSYLLPSEQPTARCSCTETHAAGHAETITVFFYKKHTLTKCTFNLDWTMHSKRLVSHDNMWSLLSTETGACVLRDTDYESYTKTSSLYARPSKTK